MSGTEPRWADPELGVDRAQIQPFGEVALDVLPRCRVLPIDLTVGPSNPAGTTRIAVPRPARGWSTREGSRRRVNRQ